MNGQGGIRTIGVGRGLAGLALASIALVLLWSASPSQGRIAIAFTVNSTDDTADTSLGDNVCDTSSAAGLQCTLRAAIQQANATATGVLIDFDLPGSGPQTIAPSTELPQVTHPVTIDGYTQPGSSSNTAAPLSSGSNAVLNVELDGHNEPASSSLLDLGSGSAGSLIQGLAMNRSTGTGILVRGSATISGNFIGSDTTGMKPRGNGFDGIFGFGGSRITIGGADPAQRNVIVDNHDSAVTSNAPVTAAGNLIGVGSDGKKPFGNHFAFHGAALDLAGPSNVVGGAGGEANVIANNEKAGISLVNDSMPSTFSHNRIYDNGEQAIDLDEDGRTINDHLDADVGPNKLQNFPKLRSAITGKSKTVIKGKIDSNPATALRIELFTAPRGIRGAVHFIGARTVTTSTGGLASFRFADRKLKKGLRVSATATSAGGATSELSDRIPVKKR